MVALSALLVAPALAGPARAEKSYEVRDPSLVVAQVQRTVGAPILIAVVGEEDRQAWDRRVGPLQPAAFHVYTLDPDAPATSAVEAALREEGLACGLLAMRLDSKWTLLKVGSCAPGAVPAGSMSRPPTVWVPPTLPPQPEGPPPPPPRYDDGRTEAWSVELSFELQEAEWDAYTRHLREYGFERAPVGAFDYALAAGGWVAVGWSPRRWWGVDLREGVVESRRYTRATADSLTWQVWHLGASAWVGWPLAGGGIVPFADLGAGPAWGLVRWKHGWSVHDEYVERRWGRLLEGSAGLRLTPWPSRPSHMGAAVGVRWTSAPVVVNEFGEVRESGGLSLYLGVRQAF